MQDIDVLLPVLLGLTADPAFQLRILVSRWLAEESPRTAKLLRRRRLPFDWIRRRHLVEGTGPDLREVDFVLAASESSHPAHAAGHALARSARSAGIRAYALQHGFENVGLRGPEAEHLFASDVVFCWSLMAADRNAAATETLAKISPVGRPRLPIPPAPTAPLFDVGVFENLHADTSHDGDRSAFAAGVAALGRTGARVLLSPHPAGGWGECLTELTASWPNLLVQTAAERRAEIGGAIDAIAACRRIITSPSTVALDAAQQGRPVAVCAPGGAIYEALPLLRSADDWARFAASNDELSGPMATFVADSVLPGDATVRILQRLKRDLREKRLAG